MNSVAKDKKNFKLKGKKSQIKLILKTLIALNKNKTSPEIKYILASQIKSRIVKMLKRYKRLLKIYWAIDAKNKNYKQSSGIEEYSASDIYNMVTNLLKNDGYKKVCKRTIERDIKLLNEMGLLQSKIRRLGKQKGSISHYRQNMTLTHIHKEIIYEYLINLLKESLSDKKIIGDFDDAITEDETFNYANLEKIETLSNLSEHNKITPMSHVEKSHVFKANISYINNKNSIENSKEMLSEKIVTSTQKIRKCKFERQDVESRLISIQKIDKKYLKQIKERCNNDATYINALINLETAIIEYKNEYNLEDILEHFLKQFDNNYKHKVWMMMKRRDGVINDYELIWEGRFIRDWYQNKYKSGHVVKETYGENIRVGNKILNTQISNQISNNLQHKRDNELEKLENEKEKKKRRLELKRREEYIKKLFEQEAQEMQERLRKAKEEKELLKKQIKENMIGDLGKKVRTISDNMIDTNNLIGFNSGLSTENSNNLSNYQPISEGFCKSSGPAVACPKVSLKVNYEGFKTIKGMVISLSRFENIENKFFPNQEKGLIKEKGKVI